MMATTAKVGPHTLARHPLGSSSSAANKISLPVWLIYYALTGSQDEHLPKGKVCVIVGGGELYSTRGRLKNRKFR
jgi:hypothetical protein